jgi:hypothetical protein
MNRDFSFMTFNKLYTDFTVLNIQCIISAIHPLSFVRIILQLCIFQESVV